MKELIDDHGRKIRKLRLSLTDKCNLRCHYCMPVDATFMDEEKYLSPDEIFTVVEDLCQYGLQELRLTGGEPLMRKSFSEIIQRISPLPLKKIGLTTNGIYLDRYLDVMKEHRVHHLNISLDSLDEESFKRITRGNQLKKIISNIEAAQKMGFHIKVNVVAMKGINDHELLDFVEFSKNYQVEVRFLELMRIGHALGKQNDQFISAKEMIGVLKQHHELKSLTMEYDSTSFNYLTPEGANVGFIASESQAFCGNCSRWRLSADGMLRACLLKDDGLTIKHKTGPERAEIYHSLLGMKPFTRPLEVAHQMNAIGG